VVQGLAAGDYLTKPFNPGKLLASGTMPCC
jgi:DNA-binding response OmpR family regulator